MRFTSEQYQNYLARCSKASTESEQVVRTQSVAEIKREEGHSERIHVRITSFRVKLCDPDNLCVKYFVDCLRYATLIPNDRPEDIELTVTQEKVNHRIEERTEILIC